MKFIAFFLFFFSIVNASTIIQANTVYQTSVNSSDPSSSFQVPNVPAGKQISLKWTANTFVQGAPSGWVPIIGGASGNLNSVGAQASINGPLWYYDNYSMVSECPKQSLTNASVNFYYNSLGIVNATSIVFQVVVQDMSVLTPANPTTSIISFKMPLNDYSGSYGGQTYSSTYTMIDISSTGAGTYRIFVFFNDTSEQRWLVAAINYQCIGNPTTPINGLIGHGQSRDLNVSAAATSLWFRFYGYIINSTGKRPPVDYVISYCFGASCTVTPPSFPTPAPTPTPAPSTSTISSSNNSQQQGTNEESNASNVFCSVLSVVCVSFLIVLFY